MHKIHIVPSSDMHLVVGHSRLDPGSPFPPERPAEWQKPVDRQPRVIFEDVSPAQIRAMS